MEFNCVGQEKRAEIAGLGSRHWNNGSFGQFVENPRRLGTVPERVRRRLRRQRSEVFSDQLFHQHCPQLPEKLNSTKWFISNPRPPPSLRSHFLYSHSKATTTQIQNIIYSLSITIYVHVYVYMYIYISQQVFKFFFQFFFQLTEKLKHGEDRTRGGALAHVMGG